MHAQVGVATLMAWDAGVCRQALGVYQRTAQEQLRRHQGGYLVEAADGLCLVAFTRPSTAIRWALGCVSACLEAEWWVHRAG